METETRPLPTSLDTKLFEAMGYEECPVCQLVRKAVFDYFARLFGRCIREPEPRAEIRATRGFCNYHSYYATQMAGRHSLPFVARELVEAALEDLPTLCGEGGRETVRPTCLACAVRDETRDACIAVFVNRLENPAWQERYLDSEGLCREHTADACALAPAPVRGFLVEATRCHLDLLASQLARSIEIVDRPEWRQLPREVRSADLRTLGKMGGSIGTV